jgi:hypothetical protein
VTVDVVAADLAAACPTVTDVAVGSDPATPVVDDAWFLDAMVSRVCADTGAPSEDVRRRADELLVEIRDARVRTFISVLLEKQLRRSFRRPAPTW